jgi:hypothetical protein
LTVSPRLRRGRCVPVRAPCHGASPQPRTRVGPTYRIAPWHKYTSWLVSARGQSQSTLDSLRQRGRRPHRRVHTADTQLAIRREGGGGVVVDAGRRMEARGVCLRRTSPRGYLDLPSRISRNPRPTSYSSQQVRVTVTKLRPASGTLTHKVR